MSLTGSYTEDEPEKRPRYCGFISNMRSFIACHIPERWWRVHIGFDEISPSASSKRDLGTRLPTYIPIKSIKWFNRKWRSVFSACFLVVNWLSRSVAKSANYKGEVVTRVGHWRMTFWRLSFLTRGYPKSIQRGFFYGFRYVNVPLAHFALSEVGSSAPTRTHWNIAAQKL